jgi:broad specificity phosphatase PhoE
MTGNLLRIARRGLLGLLLIAVPSLADQTSLVDAMRAGGHVLMIRHAYAPGTGDPAHFQLDDCRTQRNLNDQGRDQATALGEWLRARGIARARVFSSQWCRCLETAERIALGPVTPLPALNSFFERPREREPSLAALRDFLARQPRDGQLILLVTHFVTIAGLTKESLSSGEGVLLVLKEEGGYEVVGRPDFSQ